MLPPGEEVLLPPAGWTTAPGTHWLGSIPAGRFTMARHLAAALDAVGRREATRA
ncbi:hypothetical protein RM780_19215 [Streptomyces sp. DSM 44917]|uniref:Uncharacterized protein n=1 Tax=Streptomyces boetiae TaxID=3075541 RepID=A0ABU2LBZ1_9ACTN|nr:hypothetical protein [Streptomyces sp. DSM 44917]MDT0309074.1 hypothetical protein [Streptomyces sp. DSM 44917]